MSAILSRGGIGSAHEGSPQWIWKAKAPHLLPQSQPRKEPLASFDATTLRTDEVRLLQTINVKIVPPQSQTEAKPQRPDSTDGKGGAL